MNRIHLDTQSIVEAQASLARTMTIQHTEVKDNLDSQTRDQGRAFASHEAATTQIGMKFQDTKAQLEAMLTLQQSLVGSVSPASLIRKTISYISDTSQGFDAFPGPNDPDTA